MKNKTLLWLIGILSILAFGCAPENDPFEFVPGTYVGIRQDTTDTVWTLDLSVGRKFEADTRALFMKGTYEIVGDSLRFYLEARKLKREEPWDTTNLVGRPPDTYRLQRQGEDFWLWFLDRGVNPPQEFWAAFKKVP